MMEHPVPATETEFQVPAAETQQEKKKERASLREYLESLLVTIVLVLFGTSFIVQAFKIPSQSMEDTLLVGDHLLVNKFVYGGRGAWYDRFLPYRDIRRGDIIVFKFPFDDHDHYVKRVIGVPGDRLRIVDQQVYVNGQPLEEAYKVHSGEPSDAFGDNFPPLLRSYSSVSVRDTWAEELPQHVERGELVVPPHKYFVLGDNRDQSLDSRYWGFVGREGVMGRPILIYWSIESTSDEYTDRSLAGRLLGMVRTLISLPTKTRWDRMFRVVR